MAGDSGVDWNQRLTIGVVLTCLLLSVLSFGLRLYARTVSAAKLWYDDYWMCWVMVLAVAMTSCDFVGLANGSGQHEDTLQLSMMTTFMRNLYAYMLLWATGVFSVKIGILLFYWRVFPTPTFRYAIVAVACLSGGIFLSNFFSFMLQCLPVSKFWDPTEAGSCIDQNTFYLASAIINVGGDVAVLFLPLPVVWNLHTSKNKKWSLSFLFLLGAFVCVASIFRIIAVKEIDPTDFTFSNVAGGLWSTVEVEIGFICANLPAIRPLIARWFGHGSQGGTNSSAYGASKLGGSRGGHITLRSKSGDGDLEMMTQGNGSDEITLTKAAAADRAVSTHSDATRRPSGGAQGGGDGGGGSGGGGGRGMQGAIRVRTDVQITSSVDEWNKDDQNLKRGVPSFVSPV